MYIIYYPRLYLILLLTNKHIFSRKLRFLLLKYWTIDKKFCSLVQHIWRLLLFDTNYEQPVKFISDMKTDEAPQDNFPINEQKNVRKYDLARNWNLIGSRVFSIISIIYKLLEYCSWTFTLVVQQKICDIVPT